MLVVQSDRVRDELGDRGQDLGNRFMHQALFGALGGELGVESLGHLAAELQLRG